MLWAVQFEWPSGVQFSLNCYRFGATLVVFNKDGSGHFLHIKEGVTQGYPLTIITFGIGIFLMICKLYTTHAHIMQPWYGEDSVEGGAFEALHDNMYNLLVRRSLQEYFPDLTKSILVVFLWNVQRAEAYLRGMGVQVVTGSRYLGVFIGDQET